MTSNTDDLNRLAALLHFLKKLNVIGIRDLTITVRTPMELTADFVWTNLTIMQGGVIATNGYRVITDRLDLTNGGSLRSGPLTND